LKLIANCSYQIEWIYTEEFPGRAIPLVILADGRPGYVINQWIYWLLEEDIQPSTLEKHVRAVMQLYEFHYRKYGPTQLTQQQAQRILADFLDAKRHGSELMGWPANNNKTTLKRLLASINLFDEWQATYHGGHRLNPSEQRFLSTWETYRKFKIREKWDPMLHLFPSQSHSKTEHEHKVRIGHKRFQVGRKSIPKAFPIERFVELVEHTPNPRDQMLWLLMGGASLRQSETLHIYYQDILGIRNDGSTRIRIADPEEGEIHWEKDGKSRKGTRQEYLSECYSNHQFKYTRPELYNLSPRTKGKRGADHAGFKGMTFSTDGEQAISADGRIVYWHELFWCDPRFGSRFQKAYEEYVAEHFHGKPRDWPYHPYLFINLEKNEYGLPMTLGALRGAWKRAVDRIGMGNCGLGPHSLRHMYGSYSASILKLPLEVTRTLMRHASTTSTEAYYHLRSDDVRKAIATAVIEHAGVPILDYLIMPDTPRLSPPATWSE
jgi:integrase